ncbi:hypothetical protein HPP92_008085 [Vanilla planifolia]|uniref:Uncharacterized protein n=1 Tax=Vanilla planifolia TaxID=51239 RepID=A0A835R5N1_VANPL|nr:hypothetical protein HPP92_008085 [Vanilla planifolia]
MSWLSSLGISMKPNSFGLGDVDEVHGVSSETGASAKHGVSKVNEPIKLGSPSREDLSEFTEPLSNKFLAVASLGPHPTSPYALVLSKLSNKVNVNEISKIASSFLPLGQVDTNEYLEEEYEDDLLISDVFGVTDEVLAFATNIACHPETWLDYPLLSEDESCDDKE